MKVYVHCCLNGRVSWQDRQSYIEQVIAWEAEIAKSHKILNFLTASVGPETATIRALAKEADVVIAFCLGPSLGFGRGKHNIGRFAVHMRRTVLAFVKPGEMAEPRLFGIPPRVKKKALKEGQLVRQIEEEVPF